MLTRRLVSVCMCFVMLNFSLDFHNFLCAFDKQKFLMLMFLDLRMSIKSL